jgi:thiamine kinase-like enzyme
MNEKSEAVLSVLRNAPGFEKISEDVSKVTRLGGLTNRVYHVETPKARVIVRIPGEGTEDYIDRSVEVANANAAWRAGVSAQVLWADPMSGNMVSRAIDEIETMTPALFASREGAPGRAGRALAKLHNSGEAFEFRFELFTMIDEYLSILSAKDAALPEGYHDIVRAAAPVKQALADKPARLAPCHCDPLCENFLDDGDQMWIVDWEYSGMNDPLWDVGDLSVEAGMDADAEAELLNAYFGRAPTPAEVGRVVIYKAMCDLLWTLWGLIQHADDNPAEDFWAYATTRFDRCKALMHSDAFPVHLAAVREG